jgi:hypothetical protein
MNFNKNSGNPNAQGINWVNWKGHDHSMSTSQMAIRQI